MRIFISLFLAMAMSVSGYAQQYELNSPNEKLKVSVRLTDKVYYKVAYEDQEVIWYSPLSMTLEGGNTLGYNPKVKASDTKMVNESIATVWGIRSEVVDHYQELRLKMEGNYQIVFRAYDEGVAYRFETTLPNKIIIQSEEVAYYFLNNDELMAHVVGDFQSSYEKIYTKYRIKEIKEAEFISLPLVVSQEELTLSITEADVYDYPGMYIMKREMDSRNYLEGLFPGYPTEVEQGGWGRFNMRVTERADYLAITDGTRTFPWRVMSVAKEATELVNNDLVYKLARPSKIDTDWIRPGKVAWDWWNDWNLTGVDFETGINNRTYEYYIDFAAKNNIEYVIMDEGWSDQFDLFVPRPDVDVPYLAEYAEKKGLKLILWCVWHTLDRQMQAALDQFEAWGIAGVKVDFIDRDDQLAINFYERLAREAGKRKLLIDYHGCSKPTGLHRTYPNVINFEGVRGNEYNKFSTGETPDHNVNIVYTRMLAGPIDYTPGAMRNSVKGEFMTSNANTMSYGTRCHQLGMYVVYYAPLQMLCDAPTAYEAYPDILKMLSEVPVTWDETVPLAGELGEYIVVARKKGKDWWIGALGDWEEREVELDLSFLGEGSFVATQFLDGINAHRKAEDYQVKEEQVNKDTKLKLMLKPGGGALIKLAAE